MQGYISVKEAASRWGVSERRVKQYCTQGRINNLIRFGKAWAIPENAEKPNDLRKNSKSVHAKQKSKLNAFSPMPLMQSAFTAGICPEYVETIQDADQRAIAHAEYYYFSAQPQKASEIAELYISHRNVGLRLSACLIYGFANLSLGHINLARQGLAIMKEQMSNYCGEDLPPEINAYGIFIYTTASVLLHMPQPNIPPLEEIMQHLPLGLRFFGCYILAHKAYLDGDYSHSLGIALAALSMSEEVYPIPMIYMLLIIAMCYMNLKDTDKGRKYFLKAWELAKTDGFVQPFAEHHGLLHGLIESCLKNDYPEEYQRIIDVTYAFSNGWRKVHNPATQAKVADNLTTMEFTVAMLKSRGWNNAEIAKHLQLSEYTIKTYISSTYQKLNISTKSQLKDYLLQ